MLYGGEIFKNEDYEVLLGPGYRDTGMPKLNISCSSRQKPSATAGRSLFSPLPPAFAVVPQYRLHIPVDLLPLSRTGQAAFPYIRLFGGSFSWPPLYDTGSGLCGPWV